MKYQPKITIIAAGLLFLGFGCGQSTVENAAERQLEESGQTNANVEIENNGQISIETDQGSYVSGGSLPESWPSDMPIMPGGQVQMAGVSSEETNEGAGVVFQINKTADEIAAFYKTELPKSGWQVESTMSSPNLIALSAKKTDPEMTIGIVIQTTTPDAPTIVTMGLEK